jgi:Uncharacterized protein involved in copper resistance
MTGAARAVELEIAVTSPAGALAASAAGADRVELCAALELGGITPSQALIEQTASTGAQTHVLVRCRPGDFVYDSDELALMEREIVTALRSGAHGVVVGALTRDGTLDIEAMQRFVAAARAEGANRTITAHRAVDHAAAPVATVARLTGLGIDRVLTSGGAGRAVDGTDVLARMRAEAPDIELMAGGGVDVDDVPRLLSSGADAVHLSAKVAVPPSWTGSASLGVAAASGALVSHYVTDGALAAAARAAVDQTIRARVSS